MMAIFGVVTPLFGKIEGVDWSSTPPARKPIWEANMHSESITTRFWSKVAKSDDDACWLWIGETKPSGYGAISIGGRKGKRVYAHRLSWEIAHGKTIPDGMYVCHSCDTPGCVNPHHLFLGTHSDNMQDSIKKGRFNRNPVRGTANHWSRLSEQDIPVIRALAAEGMTHKEIAQRYGMTRPAIGFIVNRKTWSHVP